MRVLDRCSAPCVHFPEPLRQPLDGYRSVNALAESVIGLYKTECVRHDGPWRGVDDLELATLSWIYWFNHNRLHSSIGHIPPSEFEALYYRHNQPTQQPLAAVPSLPKPRLTAWVWRSRRPRPGPAGDMAELTGQFVVRA